MKNKHCYSIENLLHLGCGNCRGWWTIGDGDPSNPYHCPHCGYQSLTEPAATLESKKENQVFDEVLEQENLPTEPADKRTIVVFSGAGLSAESGIPTFRGNDSLWEQHRVEDVASQDGWIKNRSLVLDFYAQRFEAIKAAEPNLAHKAIARLQEKFNVVNITQNIDDLLERAGCKDVWHLHGFINRKKCERHHEISNLDGDTIFTCDYKTETDKPVVEGERCPKCQRHLRPEVVWFGEAVDLTYDRVAKLVKEVKYRNGVFICCGTSAQVYPAAWLLPFFSQVKNKYIIDLKPVKVADYTLIEGSAGEELDKLATELLSQ